MIIFYIQDLIMNYAIVQACKTFFQKKFNKTRNLNCVGKNKQKYKNLSYLDILGTLSHY